ncbi:MAG TPA: hypothetical protein PLS07_11075 [Niabella sp.]|nr:hypothetical protein [Niabella sp.]HQW15166.1 hypothetical protein [Niabella sp.]HQX20367.1 hypothetical protein [Niabella sp.]HQX41673.1 hypothetical protein [Niabella sp.]HRB28159.1 hypothetical protein [Niabella sp.]
MSLLNQNNKKGKKDAKGGANKKATGGTKFAQKPNSQNFVSKQQNTGSQRGS